MLIYTLSKAKNFTIAAKLNVSEVGEQAMLSLRSPGSYRAQVCYPDLRFPSIAERHLQHGYYTMS